MTTITKTLGGKLVILGDNGVGKTCMAMRYVEGNFNVTTSPTIGASYFTCKIDIDETLVKLHIWDTAGQERFRAMTPIFYKNSNAALLVYDITRLQSFESIKYWAHELKRNVQEPMVLCVIGNKSDLIDERVVPHGEALQYANSIGASYFECSAKDNLGLEQVFLSIATGIIRLSDNTMVRTLKVYEGNVDSPGRIERPGHSIQAIAHANEVYNSKCC